MLDHTLFSKAIILYGSLTLGKWSHHHLFKWWQLVWGTSLRHWWNFYLECVLKKENRGVSLYLMTNKLGMTLVVTQGHSDMLVKWNWGLCPRKILVWLRRLIEEDKLTRLLTKLVSVIDFIRKDYLKRYEEFQWIHDTQEEIITLLKSTRKRSASSLDD